VVTRQPPVHDLVACVRAPTAVLSSAGGDIVADGAQGAFTADVRVLSEAVLAVGGQPLQPLQWWLDGPSGATFVSMAAGFGTIVHDPTAQVRRERETTPDGLRERIVLTSYAEVDVETELTLDVAVDLARVHLLKGGQPTPEPLGPKVFEAGATWSGVGPDGSELVIRVDAPEAQVAPRTIGARLVWPVRLPAHAELTVTWGLRVSDPSGVVQAPESVAPWADPRITCDDRRVAALVDRSLLDLDALRLVARDLPAAQFAAAGAPWYLTLFGRDSLWTARLLLPLGTGLADGTLSVLAARQGDRHDVGSAEAPGKVLHEVRRAATEHAAFDAMQLPPTYFGTVDATPLWVLLLHDAWCWGMADDRVERLLPHLERAMGWIAGDGDADGDGFLEYIDTSGRGLANQGWKDSPDAVRFADGRQAVGPIALAEVQGYAHEAAVGAARLLTAYGRPGADRWLDWAEALAKRFREQFWVEDSVGPFPAMALDGAKRPVDSLTSNIGHLLGSGLLSADEAVVVAGRLAGDDLDTGFGLRTMSAAADGYAPLSYHCGSVWPHDTAIVALGLASEGFAEQAAGLAMGLVDAAGSFGWRLPELYAGSAAGGPARPVPYPAACQPQAWAAAAGVAVLQVLLGVSAPARGELVVSPPSPSPVGALSVSGLVAPGGRGFSLEIDRDGLVVRQELSPA
jgi:N-terminal domain of (some) glycogen debranching enzymes